MRIDILFFLASLLAATSAWADDARGPVTFSEHVAPIFQARCVYCHRADEIAPMSLMDYESARPWAESIREEVLERRMPPWKAAPGHISFTNESWLTQDEVDTIVAWVDGNAEEGDASKIPPDPEFVDGWQIGEPDLIINMVEEYTVPATGTIEYQFVKGDYVFEEDTWVQAIEIRPGNRSVVHHAAVSGYGRGTTPGEGVTERIPLHLYAPGLEAIQWREGYGKLVPAGTEVHFNLHYTTTGLETTDLTKIGFILAKEKPHTQVHTQMVMNTALRIGPGEPNHQIISGFQFPNDGRIVALRPHMHLRGRNGTTTAITPDGRREVLLHIPEWDDNWQNYYILSAAKQVHQGSLIEFAATYDNSWDNLYNPDPEATVTWGQQVWDEMMVVYMTWIEDNTHNMNDPDPIQLSVNEAYTTGRLAR